MADPVVLLSTGDVVGPNSSTDGTMVLFDGTTGKKVKGNNAVVTAQGLALLDDTTPAANRATIGLDQINNTSDINKPVSTAQQAALDLKANLASPTFTGDPKAPTPAQGDNDQSLATTAFVYTAMKNRGANFYTGNNGFVVPPFVFEVWVSMSGGGGGGAAYLNTVSAGGGGGGAGSTFKVRLVVTPGDTYAITVGQGGQGGQVVGANGSSGGSSSFGVALSVGGGGGGVCAGDGGVGGAGTNVGGNGQAYNPAGASNEQGGGGGGTIFGQGGVGGVRSGGTGAKPGGGYGWGGGGGVRNVGGPGGNGFVLVEYAA